MLAHHCCGEETGAGLAGCSGSCMGGARTGGAGLGGKARRCALPSPYQHPTQYDCFPKRCFSPGGAVDACDTAWEEMGGARMDVSSWRRPGRGTARSPCWGSNKACGLGLGLGYLCQPLLKGAHGPPQDHQHHGNLSSNNKQLALNWCWRVLCRLGPHSLSQ